MQDLLIDFLCQMNSYYYEDTALYQDADPCQYSSSGGLTEQESPAIADKPAQRESLPKIAPIRRAYNIVADVTGLSSFV